MFNALEPQYETDAERIFAVGSELSMGLIYGALAGVISTIMLSLKGNEQEYTGASSPTPSPVSSQFANTCSSVPPKSGALEADINFALCKVYTAVI